MKRIFTFTLALVFAWSASAQKTFVEIPCNADKIIKHWNNKRAPHSNEITKDEFRTKAGHIANVTQTVFYLYKADADKADNWVRWEEWTGVDVEWITTAQEQTPLLFLDEKQMPDMFFQPSGLSVPQINEYGQGGLLVNYMDHLDKMPNLAARYAEDPMFFDAVKDGDGNIYDFAFGLNWSGVIKDWRVERYAPKQKK